MKKKSDLKASTYVKKTPKKKRVGSMCPVCSNCDDRSFCKNRKDNKLMRKCPKCKACTDAEHCDTFYINEEHKVSLVIGRDEKGNIKRKGISGKSVTDAIYNAKQYEKDVEDGIIDPTIKSRVHSITSIIQGYEDTKLKNGKIIANTYRTNMETLNRIKCEDWANKPINKVSKDELEHYFLKERANGKSNSIIKKDFNMVRNAFDIALEKEYIIAKQHYFLGKYGLMRPTSLRQDKKVKALQLDDQLKLIRYLETHDVRHKDLFLLGLNTGARVGELLALQVEDVNLDKNYIHIQRTTTIDEDGSVIIGDTTKNSTGNRIVTLNKITKPIIEHAIKHRNHSEDGLIFCKDDGSVYGDGGINSAFKRICKNAGITEPVNTHMLRHTFVTRAKEAGMDVEATASLAGHTVEVAQNIYDDNQQEYLENQSELYSNYMLNLQKQ